MLNGNVRFFVIALMAILLADWAQPMLPLACTPAPTLEAGHGSCGMSPAAMKASCCAASAEQAAAEQGGTPHASGHKSGSSANAAGATCSMQICSSVMVPVLTANVQFVTVPIASEYVVARHANPVLSSPVSGLFRPPRISTTYWG